jgi:hypothetical protein
MKITNSLFFASLGLVLSLAGRSALAQDNGGGAASAGQVRQEVRSLINDLNDPNYDYSKVPERMREVFQDFGAATSSMDPDTSRQFRQDLMQQLRPVLEANQQKIQEAMQMAFLKGLQQPMGCSDDEFEAIRPYLQKVVEAYQAAQVFRFGPRNNRNGNGNNQQNNAPAPRPQQSATPPAPVAKAVDDLQSTLSDPNAPSDLIHNKLDVLRQARDKAQQDLSIARQQLQQLLTQRQEAVLVEYGLLE